MAIIKRRRSKSAKNLISMVIRQLPHFFGLLRGLFKDPRVARIDKAFVIGVIAYIVAPIDLLPDFLGLFGLTDDVFLLGLALNRMVHRAGPEVILDHWRGSDDALDELLGGLDDLGTMLPEKVRGFLEGSAERGEPSMLP